MKTQMLLRAGVTAAAISVPWIASQAAPTSVLYLDVVSQGITKTVADNSPEDFNPAVGALGYAHPMGDFLLSLTTGYSEPLVGALDTSSLGLKSVALSSTALSELQLNIWYSDVGFVSAGDEVSGTGRLKGLTGGTTTAKAWLDDANALFGQGEQVLDFSPTSGGLNLREDFAAPVTGEYSMTLLISITHGPGLEATTFESLLRTEDVAPAPVPSVFDLPDSGATLVLLGGSLIALAVWPRRARATGNV